MKASLHVSASLRKSDKVSLAWIDPLTRRSSHSGLNLTSERDKLNAFQGILHALKSGFNKTFFWGMPLSFFDSALSWNLGVRRNDATHILKQNGGNIVAVPFPSWSWVGWMSRYSITGAGENAWKNDESILHFYYIDEDGTIRELASRKQDVTFLVR